MKMAEWVWAPVAAALAAASALRPLAALGVLGVSFGLAAALTAPVTTLLFVLGLRFPSDLLTDPSSAGGSTSTVAVSAVTLAIVGLLLFSSRGTHGRVPGAFVFAALAFLSWVLLRAYQGPSTAAGLREATQWLTFFAVFLIAARMFDTAERGRQLARFLVVAAAAQSAWAILQVLTGTGLAYATTGLVVDRGRGSFVHPGWLAAFLAIALVVLATCGYARRVTLLLGAIITLGLLVTFARGGWLFAVLALVVYATLRGRWRVAVGTGLAACLLLLVPVIWQRFTSEFNDGQASGSYASRRLLRNYALELWGQHPLIGNGSASFFDYYSPMRFTSQIEAHGDVPKLLADQGVVGLVLYLLVLLTVARALWRFRREPWAAAPLALVLTLAVMGNVDVYFRMNTVQIFLWAVLGAAVSRARAHDSRSLRQEQTDVRSVVRERVGGVGA